MAVTVREPALVPWTLQKAFYLMRTGRQGPCLIDLPLDVQMGEIEFDPDTYAPLEVSKPRATRAQIEKALGMLNDAEKPLIIAAAVLFWRMLPHCWSNWLKSWVCRLFRR